MPEFGTGGIAEISPQFQQVRAIDKTGRGAVVGKAISDVITGVSVFGKAAAREEGVEAAEQQTGLELTEEQVNREVGDINDAIARGLSTEKDIVGGPVSSKRVSELKDASLREATLTDRHIQGLIDSGSISSTEGNARRRIALAKLKNQGSNFLFANEFDNAFFSVTGGTRGSAQAAIFPKTADEIRQDAINQERVKVEAEFEGQKQNIKLLFPNSSESAIHQEMVASFEGERRLKEIELQGKERSLSQEEGLQRLNLTQANITRSLEVNLGEFSQEDGMLDQASVLTLQTRAQQAAQVMTEQLSGEGLLNKSLEADIASWLTGQNARIDLASKQRLDKQTLDIMNVTKEKWGVLANTSAAMLSEAGNLKLVEELNVLPLSSIPSQIRLRIGEEGARNLEEGSKLIRDIANFNITGMTSVKDPANVAVSLATQAGRSDAGKQENRKKWINIYSQAPEIAFSTFSKVFSDGTKAPTDPNEKTAILDMYNVHQANLSNTVRLLGTKFPTVRILPSPDGFVPDRIVMDIAEDLQGVPGVQEALSESYIAFKRNPWLWEDKGFDHPADAFNAYVAGGFSMAPENFEADVGRRGTIVRETPPVKK